MSSTLRIQFRRGTAAEWSSANPVLASAEFGYETDTAKSKIGDGVTAWNSLPYESGAVGPQGPAGATGPTGPAGSDASVTNANVNAAIAVDAEESRNALGLGTAALLDAGDFASAASKTSLNVLDFGVVADGITDDHLAIQAALDAAGSTNVNRVFMPAGQYLVSNVLLIPSHVVLEGEGGESTVILNPVGDLPGKTAGGGLIYATVAMVGVYSGVRNLGIDHQTNATTANGVYIGSVAGSSDASNCVVEGVTIQGYASHQYLIWNYRAKNTIIRDNTLWGNCTPGAGTSLEAIEVYGGSNIHIIGNTIHLAGNGIYVWEDDVALSDTGISDIFIDSNRVYGCRVGVLVSVYGSSSNIIVSKNILTDQETHGINVAGDAANISVQDIVIVDNVIDSATGYGLFVDSQTATTWTAISVQGNVVSNTTGDGVWIAAPNVVLAGNVVTSSSEYGIRLNSVASVSLVGNVVNGAVKTGVDVATCTNATLTGNRVVNYSQGSASYYGVRADGSGHVIAGNSFKYATNEVYAIFSTATNCTIIGNSTEYTHAGQTPFFSNGAGAVTNKFPGTMSASGNIRGPVFSGNMTGSVGYSDANIRPIDWTQTWYNAAITFDGYVFQIVDSLSATGSHALQILGGASGTTKLLAVGADGKVKIAGGLGVGNSASATAVGTLSKKMEVFDAAGASIGFVPIYASIT